MAEVSHHLGAVLSMSTHVFTQSLPSVTTVEVAQDERFCKVDSAPHVRCVCDAG